MSVRVLQSHSSHCRDEHLPCRNMLTATCNKHTHICTGHALITPACHSCTFSCVCSTRALPTCAHTPAFPSLTSTDLDGIEHRGGGHQLPEVEAVPSGAPGEHPDQGPWYHSLREGIGLKMLRLLFGYLVTGGAPGSMWAGSRGRAGSGSQWEKTVLCPGTWTCKVQLGATLSHCVGAWRGGEMAVSGDCGDCACQVCLVPFPSWGNH